MNGEHDFSSWGWVNKEIYSSKPRTLSELEQEIPGTFAAVPLEFSIKSADSVSYGL
jgi:hypothetical protein